MLQPPSVEETGWVALCGGPGQYAGMPAPPCRRCSARVDPAVEFKVQSRDRAVGAAQPALLQIHRCRKNCGRQHRSIAASTTAGGGLGLLLLFLVLLNLLCKHTLHPGSAIAGSTRPCSVAVATRMHAARRNSSKSHPCWQGPHPPPPPPRHRPRRWCRPSWRPRRHQAAIPDGRTAQRGTVSHTTAEFDYERARNRRPRVGPDTSPWPPALTLPPKLRVSSSARGSTSREERREAR